MKMKRRDFLGLAAKLAAVSTVPAVLSACGGGAGSSSTSSSSGASIDKSLAAVDKQQASIDSTHNESSDYNNEIANGQENSSAKSGASKTGASSSSIDEANAIRDFFASRTPDYSNSALLSRGAHYLLPESGSEEEGLSPTEFWQNQVNAHQTAYTQYLNQITKLKAAARLFDHENKTSAKDKTGTSKTTAMAVSRLEPAAQDNINSLQSAISELLSEGLTAGVLDLITTALQAVYEYIVDNITDWTFKILANLAIDTMLQDMSKLLIEDIDFSDKEATMMSLAKISVASLAIVGATKIQEVDESSPSVENDLIEILVSSSSITGRMSSVWLALMNQTMDNTFTKMNAGLASGIAAENDNTVDWETDKKELSDTLKSNSGLMAILSLVVKALFSVYQDQALVDGAVRNEQSFSTDSTAQQYSILFADEKNSNDQALTGFTSSNLANFIEALATLFADGSETETEQEAQFKNLASVTQKSVSSTEGSAEVEGDAVAFAEELADYAYQFTADTESDANDFATALANLAYQFTMDIENDAFEFAMQGMEYGYLFASRGEEVGVMADRILWMAVQIGVMADRIGEMADRILYTEQLIVYTEILILDFGVLIYGTIKQIVNLILTSLALILDREWYVNQSEDAVLDFIDNNVSTMLSNMQEYALATLEQQRALRQLTLDALDTINFSESA